MWPRGALRARHVNHSALRPLCVAGWQAGSVCPRRTIGRRVRDLVERPPGWQPRPRPGGGCCHVMSCHVMSCHVSHHPDDLRAKQPPPSRRYLQVPALDVLRCWMSSAGCCSLCCLPALRMHARTHTHTHAARSRGAEHAEHGRDGRCAQGPILAHEDWPEPVVHRSAPLPPPRNARCAPAAPSPVRGAAAIGPVTPIGSVRSPRQLGARACNTQPKIYKRATRAAAAAARVIASDSTDATGTAG
eukprot:COSAG01_NODE_3263_length_6335_cov_6.514593_2_plen_245_part_00